MGLVVVGIVLGVVLSRRRPASRHDRSSRGSEATRPAIGETSPAPTAAPRTTGLAGRIRSAFGAGVRTHGPSSRDCSSGPTSDPSTSARIVGDVRAALHAGRRPLGPRRARRSVRSSERPSRSICRPKGSAWSLVVGVNGAGKTTTIGKLAARLTGQGSAREHRELGHVPRGGLGAARVWAEPRRRAPGPPERGADPGAVAFDAVQAAQARGSDV